MRSIRISHPYLLFPVAKAAPKRLLTLFPEENREQKLREFEVPFPREGEEPDFWAAVPVWEFAGQTLLLCGDLPDERLALVREADERPAPADKERPLLHFAPESGWMNDPNGLLRLPGGELLLCYQFNPFGVEWGAMHWGSARSRDLLHWETGDIVLFPDEWGTIFSGSGWRDEENAAGFGPGALLFFYTSAGGTEAPWSRDGVSTQRLAVSLDGGRTLQKQPGLLLPNLAEGNRDPKVFYHPETGAYIMVLYLSEKDFAIFRSHDLIRWEQTQQLTLAPGWECPDLFRLPVEGGGEKWVFWTADGLYWVGSFDGFRFTPEQPCRCAYGSAIPYAAQTVSREPGRVLSLSWLRLPNDGRCSTGMQSIPMEFGLSHEGEEGFRLRMKPCRELWEAAGRLPGDTVPAGPWAARGTAPAGGEAHLAFPGGGLTLDTSAGRVSLCGQSFEIPAGEPCPFVLLADHGVAELYAAGGRVYTAAPLPFGWQEGKLCGSGVPGLELFALH